jgi:preprotein translocase subunit YajC
MGGLIILVFLAVLFWIAIARPQRAKARAQQELIASVEEGDEIVSAGGLYGTVKAVDGDVLHVEIADGLEVRMARNAVVGFLEDVEDEAEEARESPQEGHGEPADTGYPSGSADDRAS